MARQANDRGGPARQIADSAKPADHSNPPNMLGNSSEIKSLYLTFEIPVPETNRNISSANSTSNPQDPPSPPDLTRFIDPRLWPQGRKHVLLALSCYATFLTAYAAGAYSPPAGLMAAAYGTSRLAVLSGITTYCVGFAFAPMVLAPFSELNGRYPVFLASGVIYIIFTAVCGLVRNLPGILFARFLVGVGGSTFSTMIGGVIADMFDAKGRNTPMALFSGSVLLGTGAGPLVGGVITNRLGKGYHEPDAWKWVYWHQVIAAVPLMVALVIFFKESRGSVLLSRKAKALNKWYEQLEEAGYYGVWLRDEPNSGSEDGFSGGSTSTLAIQDEEKASSSPPVTLSPEGLRLTRIRWIVKEDEERTSVGKMISVSVYRPFHLLTTEPVVFWFSLWVSFAWAILYLTFASIPLVYARQYQWDIEESCRIFAAMMVAAALATAIGIFQDSLLGLSGWQPGADPAAHPSRFWGFMRRHFPIDAPEVRLYFTCITATLLPIGLFVFGFTADPSVHWVSPAVGIGLATMGIYSVYLATFNYLADVYHKYASSALAAQSFCRNILGGIFPLVTGALIHNLGEGRAAGLLGGIGAALTLVPWVLVFFGKRIRARSNFALVSADLPTIYIRIHC